jgi:hypothetical protein
VAPVADSTAPLFADETDDVDVNLKLQFPLRILKIRALDLQTNLRPAE